MSAIEIQADVAQITQNANKYTDNQRLVCQNRCFFGRMIKGNEFMRKTLLLLVAGLLGLFPLSSYAQDIAPQPCDSEYWRQMSARAWLEAEREIMQNQNLIFKADSVLEYTCFDRFVDVAAGPGGDIFVHTDYFGQKIIKRDDDPHAMEKALEYVVASALPVYQKAGFDHSLLGGRGEYMNLSPSTSDTFTGSVDYSQAYNCDIMSKVWKTAKCANFVDNSNFETTDGFYPFETIKANGSGSDVAGYADTIKETRKWPANLSCAGSSSAPAGGATIPASLGAGGTWQTQLTLAENKGDNLYKFANPLGEIFMDVGEKLEPGSCGRAGIKTGVKVITSNGQSHDDGVCTNPGCTYDQTGICKSGGAPPGDPTNPGPS